MVADDEVPPSRREAKKARKRRSLIEVSQRLFSEQGCATTALEQISEEVGIRQQTLPRYVDSKAALALAPVAEVVADLRTKVEHPTRTTETGTL